MNSPLPDLKLGHYLTPQNLATERENFFQSSMSNPQLVYPEIPLELIKETQLQLLAIEPASKMSTLIEESVAQHKLAELKLECELLLNLNSERITPITLQLFQGDFSVKYQELAKADASYERSFGALETLTGEETVAKIQTYLATEYQQTDWQVSVSDQSDFYVRVRAHQRQILINRQINWDFTDLDTMLAHEIDGHVLRYLNSQQQPTELLKSAFPFYIKTEEGLASFLGDYCAENGQLTLKHHALKYLAGVLAETASFREVYTFLMDHGFTESLAFQRTFRLKRGLSDTAQVGCFAKEALYYEGLIEVKEYLDAGHDAKKLFAGKFGLSDLALIPKSNKVVLPKRLEKYLAQQAPK